MQLQEELKNSMAKISKEYLKVHPWKIIEEGFHKNRDMVSESLFSLGNEYSGIRAFFDESYSGSTLVGTYYNGIYEYGEPVPNAYKGISKRSHFTINSTNWVKARFEVDGEVLDLNKSEFKDFRRELDFRNGNYIRSFKWLVNGKEISFEFERILDMKDCYQGAVRLTLSSNVPVEMKAEFILDAGVKHWGKECYWKIIDKDLQKGKYNVTCETLTTEQFLSTSMDLKGLDNEEAEFVGSELIVRSTLALNSKPRVIERDVINLISKEKCDPKALKEKSQNLLEKMKNAGFSGVFEKNSAYFANVFASNDIVIEGDKKNQQGIRYCLFQLEQAYHGYEKDNNIGAKGLTGEAYSGHAFWDSETYCLPYYLFTNKEAAKDLILFRYNTLDEARKRAKDLDCEGACFPVATRNGEEACTLWQHASCQFQPSSGVAYAIYHYMNIYQDDDFMNKYGLELLIEISKFLFTRGEYSSDKKCFGFYGVMGPDEFQLMVNHNTYTNYMGKKTFDYLLSLKKQNKYNFDNIEKKCGISDDFYKNLEKASKKMLILYDPETKLFEQHDGFYKLPHLDVDKIPDEDFPLYSHWSYDRIYRNDMIKQPDVLMFMLLFNQDFSNEQLLANYNFYEPRCIHESSLSPSVHSILAAQLHKDKEAYKFFEFATRLDLDDYNNNTREGIHMTSIAAAWMNIVYGFGGFRSDRSMLSLFPTLPKKWIGYSFNLKLPNNILNISVNKDSLNIINKGEPLTMLIYGHKRTIKDSLKLKR